MAAPRRRPLPRVRARAIASGLAAAAVATTLTGCGAAKQSPSSADASDSASPSATATATVTVTPVATPSASATATPTASAPATSAAPTTGGPLLATSDLPAVPGSPAWTQERSGPAGSAPFGLCQKTALVSIGADTVTERSFSSGQDTAAQQLVRFPDARTALRVDRVLQSWHDDCRGRVRASAVRVSPVQPVQADGATAWQYTLTYEVGGDVHAQTIGLVRRGSTASLLRLDLAGQADDSAPIPADLMGPALAAAAARLG